MPAFAAFRKAVVKGCIKDPDLYARLAAKDCHLSEQLQQRMMHPMITFVECEHKVDEGMQDARAGCHTREDMNEGTGGIWNKQPL